LLDPQIARAIPHRPPFLLLDSILDLTEESVTAVKTLDPADPLFAGVYAGHYPGQPITPGVLLCEMVFQAGAVLMSHRLDSAEGGTPVLTRIRDARFKSMVKPGDVVEISARFEEQISSAYYLQGSVRVDGKLAVRVAFTCALIKEAP
jgi:3-hydroxyacyl-[acyl-carrier-protein] dehydratase